MIQRIDSKVTRLLGVLVLCLALHSARAEDPKPLEFHVTFNENVSAKPFNGRVLITLSTAPRSMPVLTPDWFSPDPILALDVKDWKPGEKIVIKDNALGYPTRLSKLKKGKYSVQAVMDFDRGERGFAAAEGNGISKMARLSLDPETSGPIELKIDSVFTVKMPNDSKRMKFVDIESKLLWKNEGRPTRMRAGVLLPKSYESNPDKKYPVIYDVPGFGGTYADIVFHAVSGSSDVAGVEMIYVCLDANCRHGHHVFADSANNGPCGKALIEELVPYIEKTYRGLGTPAGRLLTGHSSGGWSSLWLQVTYPEFFGGVWSTAPDPVDFRDFQKINIYRPKTNMFVDEAGKERPLAHKRGKPAIFYKTFSDMEVVMGHGGQLESFEAVFSERGTDGKPKRLWNRETGEVDPAVARSWERYDIRLILEKNWKVLGPKLKGKIHVYTGDEDTFYLEGAAVLLKESLAKLGSDAVVELFPKRNHFNLMTEKLRKRVKEEMAATYKKSLPDEKK